MLIDEFLQIGQKIADLSSRSKDLRKEIAKQIQESNIENLSEDKVEFLMDCKVITITKAKESNDFNIIVKELKKI